MPKPISPAWDADKLLAALAHAEWGQLAERGMSAARTALRAIVAVLPWDAPTGNTTHDDLAAAMACSTKTIQRGLAILADLGLIAVVPGYVQNGKPRPSWIKLLKGKLVDLIKRARGESSDARSNRRKAAATSLKKKMVWCSATMRRLRRTPQDHKPKRVASSPMDNLSTLFKSSSVERSDASTSPKHPRVDQLPTCAICGKPKHRHNPVLQRLAREPVHEFVARRE